LNNDSLWCLFDWGDGTDSGWLGPYNSNLSVNINYTWANNGEYEIKVKAIDMHGAESEWSEPLSISIHKSKPYINSPLLNFLENHPRMFPLLQQRLRL